jgi:metal-responsive CopG/Arc/MetJ family transcriptional regulator
MAMPNRKKHKPMKRITVTVDPDDYAAFDRLAQEGEVTASWLIRRSMREFLERRDAHGGVALNIGPTRRRAGGGPEYG